MHVTIGDPTSVTGLGPRFDVRTEADLGRECALFAVRLAIEAVRPAAPASEPDTRPNARLLDRIERRLGPRGVLSAT